MKGARRTNRGAFRAADKVIGAVSCRKNATNPRAIAVLEHGRFQDRLRAAGLPLSRLALLPLERLRDPASAQGVYRRLLAFLGVDASVTAPPFPNRNQNPRKRLRFREFPRLLAYLRAFYGDSYRELLHSFPVL